MFMWMIKGYKLPGIIILKCEHLLAVRKPVLETFTKIFCHKLIFLQNQ
jgi:hypothetical protein